MAFDRASALRAIIAFYLPIDDAVEALRSYGWDSEAELATFTPDDLRDVLSRYLKGALTAEQVTLWADLIECREDISFDEAHEDALKLAIFRLANPEINAGITPDVAQAIIDGLESNSGDA